MAHQKSVAWNFAQCVENRSNILRLIEQKCSISLHLLLKGRAEPMKGTTLSVRLIESRHCVVCSMGFRPWLRASSIMRRCRSFHPMGFVISNNWHGGKKLNRNYPPPYFFQFNDFIILSFQGFLAWSSFGILSFIYIDAWHIFKS